ncbi:MAG: RNA polymerase sigma factor [Gammaproteobacteria bacterium]|nr:RNA polymerase sigma factor [Gammaproteobacteria bacterium]
MRTREKCSDAEDDVADPPDIEGFLRAIERRGFLMARTALGNEADAFDVLQDTMLRLVQRYAGRPAQEWRPLFYRILQNRITDARRRRSLGARLFGWLERREDDTDPLEQAPDPAAIDPARILAGERGAEVLMDAVNRLPQRQQQAFMLRCWDGLSTAESARAMGCSEGSVKTHYSRALHTLREQLEDHWP